MPKRKHTETVTTSDMAKALGQNEPPEDAIFPVPDEAHVLFDKMRAEGKNKQITLRTLLIRPGGIGNDIAINCRPFSKKLGVVALTMKEMTELYTSRFEHVKGHNALMQWKRELLIGAQRQVPKTAVGFWHHLPLPKKRKLAGGAKSSRVVWPRAVLELSLIHI